MPIDTTHNEYDRREKQWSRCRDCVEGTDAIRNNATKYLPKLQDQSDEEYEAYSRRAPFYGATGRTVQGLLGAVFRKDFTLEVAEIFQPLLDRMTVDSVDLWSFSRDVVRKILEQGRIGVLVDVPKDMKDRAFAAMYTAQNVINWETAVINGERILTRVVLRENYMQAEENDPYVKKSATQYRECYLEEGIYKQSVWRKGQNDNKYTKVPDMNVTPMRNGVALERIPFVFINTFDLSANPSKPPLLDLVDVNLSHWVTTADLEHGAHFTALPTAWVAGFPHDSILRIGSATAWVSEMPGAQAGFLEYTGQGLNALRDLKADKERMMAILGARLLEESRPGVEAAETVRLRQSGESGALYATTRSASEGIREVIKLILQWSNATDAQLEELEFELNTDFFSAKMEPAELTALMAAWQSGAISQDTFLHNLKQGEILPQSRSIDDEKDMIKNEPPAPGAPNTPGGNPQLKVVRDNDGNPQRIEST